jgi:hypothetical protein
VEELWGNPHADERMAGGTRLYPLRETPWHWFAPQGVDAGRCLVATDEVHSFPISAVTARHAVRFRNLSRAGADAAAVAAAALAEDEAAYLCHCRATAGGGVDNVQE